MAVALKKLVGTEGCFCGKDHDTGKGCRFTKETESLNNALEDQLEAANQFKQKKAKKKETIKQIVSRKTNKVS